MITGSGDRPHAGPTRATLNDVAAEAHVSVKTVYRVLRNDPVVAASTALRVRTVIDRVGLRRRELREPALPSGLTYTIGLVVDDLANPFYSQISAAIEREARGWGYQLITASSGRSPSRERSVLEGLVARQVDGLIVMPSTATPVCDDLLPAGRPVVYLDRAVTNPHGDSVLSDNDGGMRSAVEHLVAHGHRHLGFLGDDPQLWTARQRREAFLSTTAGLRLPTPAHVAMGPHTCESTRQVLSRWADLSVTAVITGNNRVTVEVLAAFRSLHHRLSLVGYDDFELAEHLDPPVTVVHQDPDALGHRAAQQLFARLQGDDAPPQTIILPTRLLVHRSGILAGEHPQPGRQPHRASS